MAEDEIDESHKEDNKEPDSETSVETDTHSAITGAFLTSRDSYFSDFFARNIRENEDIVSKPWCS